MRPHTRRRVVVMMARAVVCVLIGAGIALATPKIAATNLDRPLTGWEPVPKAGIARAASSAFAFRRERRGFLGWHPIVDATDRARDEGQSLLPSAMGVVGPVGFDPTLIERLTYEGNRHFRPAIDRKDAIVVIIESIAVGWPFATHRAIAIAHARRRRPLASTTVPTDDAVMSDAVPKTRLPDGRRVPRFAGLCTFCRFPRIDDLQASGKDGGAASVDWALYGVPFDGGVTYRPGARFGPRAIREASQYMKPFHHELGVDVAARLSCVDAGDAPVAPFDCAANATTVAAFAEALGDPSRTRLLAVGGDHSIAYANMRATWARLGEPRPGMALLHLDAHLDTVDNVWGERWGHASPFIRAIEEGVIDPAAMLSVGIRGGLNSAADLDYAKEHGVTIVRADEVDSPRAQTLLDAFRHRVAGRPLYVSVDIDVLDPAFAPGTGTPVCGGLTTREAFALIRSMRGLVPVGADVVEVLPDRDVTGITALAASQLIMEILALAAAAG